MSSQLADECDASPTYLWPPRQISSFSQYLWFHFPPVTSLVYVLSAFDKVYLSSQSYDVSPESSSRLELGAASMSASGLYTCLVTGGDIPFLEDSDSKTVMVASKFFYFADISLIKRQILSRFDILFFAMKYFFCLSSSLVSPNHLRGPDKLLPGRFRQSQLLHI